MVRVTHALALVTEILDPLAFEPSQGELLRYLGYRTRAGKNPELPQEVARVVERGLGYLRPRGMYAIYSASRPAAHQLMLGGTLIEGEIARFLLSADRVAVFVVTVGNEITHWSREASAAGDMVAAWALDAVGSYAAEATAEALARLVSRDIGLAHSVSPRFSPGYCGMQLGEQTALFDLLDANALGVTLLESMLMQPMKSVSGLLGIGPAGAFVAHGSPCDRCNATNCQMRR